MLHKIKNRIWDNLNSKIKNHLFSGVIPQVKDNRTDLEVPNNGVRHGVNSDKENR